MQERSRMRSWTRSKASSASAGFDQLGAQTRARLHGARTVAHRLRRVDDPQAARDIVSAVGKPSRTLRAALRGSRDQLVLPPAAPAGDLPALVDGGTGRLRLFGQGAEGDHPLAPPDGRGG